MRQLNEHHSFTGIQKDITISKHPSSFLYDARNIRLTARGKDTLLTITNERGPLETGITIPGAYLGHCLLDKYLIVFSTDNIEQDNIIRAKAQKNIKYIQSLKSSVSINQSELIQGLQPQPEVPELPWEPLGPLGPIAPLTPSVEPIDNPADDIESDNDGDVTPPDENTDTEETNYVIKDYITRIDLSTGELSLLYGGDLNFSIQYPIEAIASYENNNIQKVYWTDGKNQPRVINIVGSILEGVNSQFDFVRELALNETVKIQKQLGTAGSFAPGVIQYAFTYYSKHGQESNIFYVSPLLYISYKDRGGSPEDKVENTFKISVSNLDANFDYLRIYSIQRTSVNGTPIVKRVQDINIKNVKSDTQSKDFESSPYTQPTILINEEYTLTSHVNYDYYLSKSLLGSSNVKWYGFSKENNPALVIKTQGGYVTWGENSTNSSILWVSATQFKPDNGDWGYQVCETPSSTSSTIESISFSATEILPNGVSFIDTGMIGDSIDPVELLYKGGEAVVAETLEQKDNTLFLGNLKVERPALRSAISNTIKNSVSITQDTRTFYPTKIFEGSYPYSSQLTAFSDSGKTNSVPCGGFKRGDYYRCGVQFQYKSGRWSDPIWIKDEKIDNSPSIIEGTSVTVPTLKGTLSQEAGTLLYNLGYKKARAVVTFPKMQDRVTICQGVLCPTLYTTAKRITNNNLYAQSSWFFRPAVYSNTYIDTSGCVSPKNTGTLEYTSRGIDTDVPTQGSTAFNPTNLRMVEIQGDYDASNKFNIDDSFSTLHSPDIEFDDTLSILDFTRVKSRTVGSVCFESTMSDIDIQTETPAISNLGGGFIHRAFSKNNSYGIVAGLFYDDYTVNDDSGKIGKLKAQKSSVKWLIYPWHRSGSLNNDMDRPADKGTQSTKLKKKVISNLRYAVTNLSTLSNLVTITDTPQIFNSDQLSVIKIGNKVYQGNIDTLITPDHSEGLYFAFNDNGNSDPLNISDLDTPFTSSTWWKTFSKSEDNAQKEGFYKYITTPSTKWDRRQDNPGEEQLALVLNKDHVRMKYKSTPHLVLPVSSVSTTSATNKSTLPILELVRPGDTNDSFYRSTMFGGTSPDALKANSWIPCGEPVSINTEGSTDIKYSYGDTYFQRWDCLKTYPFTPEDINQIVEIGSFMLETRINIDGRYDRNRGQNSNINMTPQNFNLFNPVYNQINNFFSYKILDEDYYTINTFPNQITWTKEKQAGADVDLWTNVTLASTYDMDGSRGAISSLNSWKDQIYCFQDKGISNILFNSRVQIPTSDGIPIEISNSYKVDGVRYISDGIGCLNKWTISGTPSGLYFIDSMSNHLYHIGDGMQDITMVHNMTSWFNNIEDNEVISTLYDNTNHDLYLLTDKEALCYSEILGQFTSFMDYDRIMLIESSGSYVYTMRDGKLFWMFKGLHNNFFGSQKGWSFSFISNGVDNNVMDFDKIFATIDYRMDMFDGDSYSPDKTLDYIQVSNEYQDTGEVPLFRLKIPTNPMSYHQKGTNLQKKFRIWRIQIPRNKNSLDRIRNPWCKIKLGSNGSDNLRAILHDLNVQYYL